VNNVDNANGSQNDISLPNGSATPSGTPAPDAGNGSSIANQNGQQAPNPATPGVDPVEENRRLKGQISALQKQMIQSRRSQGTTPQNPADPNDLNAQAQQQIALAYELADGQLRRQMDEIYGLYPEMTPQELNQIRRNPWAYCSRETFMTGDVDTAKLEIEQYIADLVASRATGAPAPAVPSGQGINPSPAPQADPEPAIPGSDEDPNDLTMPMDQLEKKVMKIKAKMAVK
jgi:hypothetical protein